jgi:hypothetical protein
MFVNCVVRTNASRHLYTFLVGNHADGYLLRNLKEHRGWQHIADYGSDGYSFIFVEANAILDESLSLRHEQTLTILLCPDVWKPNVKVSKWLQRDDFGYPLLYRQEMAGTQKIQIAFDAVTRRGVVFGRSFENVDQGFALQQGRMQDELRGWDLRKAIIKGQSTEIATHREWIASELCVGLTIESVVAFLRYGELVERDISGQQFARDQDKKRAVELHAYRRTQEEFERDWPGWRPQDVTSKHTLGYDFLYTHNNVERYVEIKGTTMKQGRVILGEQERQCALQNPTKAFLSVVSDIIATFDESTEQWSCQGGTVAVFGDWAAKEDCFTPKEWYFNPFKNSQK